MEKVSEYLVLGATGSIGYAITKELLKHGHRVAILARNREKAKRLFKGDIAVDIIEGDAQDLQVLSKAAQGKKFIFHGINYPYPKWIPYMIEVTEKVIKVAEENKSTIVFPGNIYNFGNSTLPITENTKESPSSKKGKLRVDLESKLRLAAERGLCKVLVIRLPDFWGPNVTNEGVAPIFVNAIKKKPMPFVIRTDIPHQFVYTPDAASVIYKVMQKKNSQPFEVFNYGGSVIPSVKMLLEVISNEADSPLKIKIYSRPLISFLGMFMPTLRELKEMLYLYENSVIMDDQKLRREFAEIRETPLKEGVRETLQWFRENYI